MVSLTLRASLILVAHRDRVLFFLIVVPLAHPPSRLYTTPTTFAPIVA